MKRKLLSVAAVLMVSALHAQVGIGTTTPNKSAELTILSKDKGLLIPNIALKSTIDKTTIVNGNVESLLVYANVEQGDIKPGFYYWDKNRWVRIVTESDVLDANVYYDGTKFEYTDANGSKQAIDVAAIVKAHETQTTLVHNNDGTYTYTSEDGTTAIINVPADVIQEFETIISNEAVKNKVLELIAQNGGNMYYDGTKFEYTDANGSKQAIDVAAIVKAHETQTTLVHNNDGTYTYTSEDG
ncbi:hypothetical protein H4K35_15355, partial [Myroides sp. NP-2]|nr:hypothetical protein [Myroides sp. NP-2]